MNYKVILIYPNHKIEIPCSSRSTARTALKNFFMEADVIEDGIARIKVINPENEVILSLTAERK